MNPEFVLTLDRRDLIVGEGTRYLLTYANRAGKAVEFPEMGAARTWMRFKLKDGAGKEASWSAQDREDSHEFEPPPRDYVVEVAPGKTLEWKGNLEDAIPLPSAGTYSLSVEMKWPNGSASTPPLIVNVKPLSLLNFDFQYDRSARGPFQHLLWSHAEGRGSVIVMTDLVQEAGGHGHAVCKKGFSKRILESPFPLKPMVAVPPTDAAYPEHWIAWLSDGKLTALTEEYGKAKVAPFSHALPAGLSPIRPPLDNPAGGECHLAFWEQADSKSRVVAYTVRKDGSLHPGPNLSLAAGRLAWSSAFYPKSRDRIYLLAIERQGKTSLERAAWPKAGAAFDQAPLAQFPGAPLAAAAFLKHDDGITGAVLAKVRHETGAWEYFVHGYSLSAQGAYAAKQPVRLAVAKGVEFGRAYIEVGPKGEVIALMEAADGRWYLHASDGAKRKLAADADLGTPLGLTWADDAHPRALFWSARKGFRLVEIVREG